MASLAVVTNTNSSLISAIRNLVCPLCGASMMDFDVSDTVAATGVRSGSERSALDRRAGDRVLEDRAQSIECRQAARADGTQ